MHCYALSAVLRHSKFPSALNLAHSGDTVITRFRSWGQKIRRPLLVAGIIAVSMLVIALIVGIIGGYLFNWTWAGVGRKTLWDWLQLLIIPTVLAVGGYMINLTISRGEQEATKQRVITEHEIALDNQREAALQAYIDKMSELILEKYLGSTQAGEEVKNVARARTLTVLPGLDARRKGNVIQFLYDAELVSSINLYGIDLNDAILPYARLNDAFLDGAQFHKACLIGANLSNANLYGTDLSGANLSRANLSGTILGSADLSGADLTGAIVTDEQLNTAKSLKGVTMPDGSIHA
jgi:hypothetical protein